MKKLIAMMVALCVALPAMAAPKKDEKDEKGKKKEKPVPAMMWTLQVEGGTGETAGAEVKTLLAGMRGVKVEECELKEGVVHAVISSGSRVNRTDVTKALRDNKALKLKEFKVKRPDKEKDGEDKKEEKTEKPAREGDKPKKESDAPAKDGEEKMKEGDKPKKETEDKAGDGDEKAEKKSE